MDFLKPSSSTPEVYCGKCEAASLRDENENAKDLRP